MKVFNDILTEQELDDIIKLIDQELKTNYCPNVPLYQSFNNMHLKYGYNPIISKLIETIFQIVPDKNLKMSSLWFNLLESNSDYSYHKHPTDLTGVFYISGCNDYGTVFKVDGIEYMNLAKNNSILFFDGDIEHKVPSWNGFKRYTIAFDMMYER
jgi:hypothetical protein